MSNKYSLEVHTISGDVIKLKDAEYGMYGFDDYGFYVKSMGNLTMVLRVPLSRLDYYRRIKEV